MFALPALAILPIPSASQFNVFLFFGLCLGQAGLLIFAINWLHGCALPRQLLRQVRHFVVPLVPATPLLVWLIYGFNVFGYATESVPPWQLLRGLYAIVCCTLGLVVLPIVTLLRLVRRPPAVLHKTSSRVID